MPKQDRKHIIIEILGTVIGAAIMAFGVASFLLPNQLSSGGVSGITTITYYLLNIPMGTMIILINLPLFIFAWYRIGKEFLVKSLIGTVSLSLFIDILDKYPPITTDKFLASIYGGVVIGIGTAIILKVGSSTGGTELVTNLIKTYNPYISMSRYLTIIDITIVTLNVVFLGNIEIGLYSAITIYLYGKMVDIIFEGVYFTKLLFIISDKNQEIADAIKNEVQRGVTGLYGKGMYKNEDKLVLICAASRGDVYKIKDLARKIDKRSFIVVANAREVVGKGFKEI
ncbi:MAG: YitT family protein [Clostridia bacterium]|nr:YitT family protein [Clostridia bacterium]